METTHHKFVKDANTVENTHIVTKTKSEIEGMQPLLKKMTPWLQRFTTQFEDIEDVVVHLGRRAVIKHGSGYEMSKVVTAEDLEYMKARIKGIREDNRAGIDGTLHRVSAIRDTSGSIIGFKIRFGRFVTGVAEPLRGILPSRNWLKSTLFIGPPGVGKTTILRDVSRILDEFWGPGLIIIDSANEIGGEGRVPADAIGIANMRLQVPNPSVQAQVAEQGIRNLTAEVVVFDEIGYSKDAYIVESTARRGIPVIATGHGKVLGDVIENPDLHRLIGGIDWVNRRRLFKPVFDSAVEIPERGKFRYHEDIAAAVDRELAGEDAGGRWLN